MQTPRIITAALLGTALTLPLLTGTPAGADDKAGGDGRTIEAAPASRIAQAADRYGLSEDALRAQLAADESMRLNREGLLYYVDPAPEDPPRGRPSAEGLSAHAPLGQTFELHSNEGSQRTIYLDFDGHEVVDTGWNHPYIEMDNGFHPAWDPAWNDFFDGPGSFTDDELLMIQDVWARVAEDYAPFDVDVTTEEPPAAAIDRANPSDQVYGTRALISPSDDALYAICDGGCGGVAYIEAFDIYLGKDPVYPEDDHALLQPAWVFPQALGDDPKNVAEAVTHEVGHNLGLEHDGTTSEGYYTGHSGWAPIMGVGYEQPIVQWAVNDYPGAKLGGPGEGAGELQDFSDDILTMAAHGTPALPDDAGNTTSAASVVPESGTGVIGTRTDVDVFALGSCTGNLSVSADPAAVSPNLDIKLELLNAGGTSVDSDDAPSSTGGGDVATGLDAAVSTNGASGNYYVRVDGVGRGSASNGYTDYGSLGAYTLDVTGTCTEPEEPTEDAPSAPRNLSGTHLGDGTVRLTWQAPADDGGSAVTGYRVYQDGSLVDEVSAGATSTQIDGVTAGTHSFGVAAVNGAGEGAQASTNVTVDGDDPNGDVPGAVVLGKPKAGKKGKPFTAVFPWTAPAADPAIERYEVVLYRKTATGWKEDVSGELPASSPGVKITNKRKALTVRVTVRACNSVGCGDWATSSSVRLR